MNEQRREMIYQAIGVAMFVWLFAVIRYDQRFVLYFSCFAFGVMALGMLLKLKNEWLNLFTVSYLIVSVYLLTRQALWVGQYGPEADFTYLNPAVTGAPWFIHVVMHGTPILLVLYIIGNKKIAVDWKKFIVIASVLVIWSYTMDFERFIGLPDFWIAYPVGIPLTVVYMWIYGKWIRPYLIAREKKRAEALNSSRKNE
ncbi:MAG TPA: hypothetical protein VKM55_03205 [Candidatus Lokiarchaeia archaeon]|nr:hypothetical protein [Candidatus Lokiarchaeia archaeon]